MTTLPSIAIIGTGSMGGAILQGLVAPSVTVEGGIRVTNRTEAKARSLRTDGVQSFALETTRDANLLAVRGAKIVLIGVKPAMVIDVLSEISPRLEPGAIIISVAAGVTTSVMESAVSASVIRAMPNTPAIVGLAVTGLSAGSRCTPQELGVSRALFETVGSVIEVPESQIDALSTISGSGPAYVFYLIEQFIKTAVGMGFTPHQAELLVNGTFRGAVELLAQSDKTPAELRRQVTSPQGTTARAIAELEAADLSSIFSRATAAALARAEELAGG